MAGAFVMILLLSTRDLACKKLLPSTDCCINGAADGCRISRFFQKSCLYKQDHLSIVVDSICSALMLRSHQGSNNIHKLYLYINRIGGGINFEVFNR